MRYLGKTLPYAIVAACAVAGAVPASSSALVNTCSSAASPGCSTIGGGNHTYIETRSSKSGGAADYVCTSLERAGSPLKAECSYNGTFIRACYYGGQLGYGTHWGSSSAWIVDGRDATSSDATTC